MPTKEVLPPAGGDACTVALAGPARLKAAQVPPKKDDKPQATYRVSRAAQRYGKLLEDMPPLANGKVPQDSEVLKYIQAKVQAAGDECDLTEAKRIFQCLAVMKKDCPLVFDRATRLWRGCRHGL